MLFTSVMACSPMVLSGIESLGNSHPIIAALLVDLRLAWLRISLHPITSISTAFAITHYLRIIQNA